jgi:hypothetical protein
MLVNPEGTGPEIPVVELKHGQSKRTSKSPALAVDGTVMVLLVELADATMKSESIDRIPEAAGIIGKLIVMPV